MKRDELKEFAFEDVYGDWEIVEAFELYLRRDLKDRLICHEGELRTEGRFVISQDSAIDKALGIQTIGREDEKGTLFMPYEPTPCPVLERLAGSGWLSTRDHVADWGCGKGRVAIFLAAQVGCRVTGIDYADKLIAMAQENRLRCPCPDRVAFVCARAERYAPAHERVHYFFNPFSRVVFESVLRRLNRADDRVICYFPTPDYEQALCDMGFAVTGQIDCGDLFPGGDAREKLILAENTMSST